MRVTPLALQYGPAHRVFQSTFDDIILRSLSSSIPGLSKFYNKLSPGRAPQSLRLQETCGLPYPPSSSYKFILHYTITQGLPRPPSIQLQVQLPPNALSTQA